MRLRFVLLAASLLTVLSAGVASIARDAAPRLTVDGAVTARAAGRVAIRDTTFGARILRLSEPGGYFDTDNLISNERSYLHVAADLRARAPGGAYIGVGPAQNFAYIALLRPEIAYIVDIRRDNLLEHLLFKALFERADTRVAYLADLTGRLRPAADDWAQRSLPDIVAYLDTAAAPAATFDSVHADVRARLERYGYPLDAEDLATIERFHRTFHQHGLGLRFTSHGRAPMPYYPSYRELLLAADRAGVPAGAFADHEGFQFLKRMHGDHRIIPVVGDFAGPTALRAIGDELRRDRRTVRAFYTSNVEYYLFRERVFDRFTDNLRALPWDDDAIIVRAVFRSAPPAIAQHWMPGYGSAQVAQRAAVLLDRAHRGGYDSYFELLADEPLPPR